VFCGWIGFIGYRDSIIAASPARRGALSQDVCRQGIGALGLRRPALTAGKNIPAFGCGFSGSGLLLAKTKTNTGEPKPATTGI